METSFAANFLCFSCSLICEQAPDKGTQTQVKAIGSVVCVVFLCYYREFLASLTAHKKSTLFPLILSVSLANTSLLE